MRIPDNNREGKYDRKLKEVTHGKIRRIGELKWGEKIEFCCNTCGQHFFRAPSSYYSYERIKYPCPACRKKEMSERLLKKMEKKAEMLDVTLIDTKKDPEITVGNWNIKYRCNKCGKEHTSNAVNFVHKGKLGCRCRVTEYYGKIHNAPTQEEFRKKIEGIFDGTLKVLGEYINVRHKIQVRCVVCGREWEAWPHLLLKGHGCASCAQRKRQDRANISASFDRKLAEKYKGEITRTSEYTGAHNMVKLHCNKCGKDFTIVAANILKSARHNGHC